LAGGIAHDFNNLHTAINGMSELALIYLDKVAATSEIDRVRNYLGEIQRLGQRAAGLTQQLLAYSRKQVLYPKVLDLRVDLVKAQELLNQILGDNITLILELPAQLGLVVADPSQIEQAVMNLVINARDAMPRGGTLTIRLLNLTLDEEAARHQVRLHPGSYVVMEIEDNGFGMTLEVQARLFDPFFTTKAVGEGSGLGLATVYGIIRQSGGVIEAESQPGHGSTFRIFLPQASPQQDAQMAPTPVRGGIETILLVDEESWARRRWRSVLEAKGYLLLDAASGKEAISLCQSYTGPIHLLVISGEMSDMLGTTLANQALLSRPDLRVLLSQSGEEELIAPPLHFSLAKPILPETLTAKVRSVLDTPIPTTLL